MNALISHSGIELARLIRERQASSVEVMAAHLARIDALEPRIHAIAAIDRDASLAVARAADAALASGDDVGPLHGVPFTVKDWIEAAGLPCAAGIEARRNFVPKRDATAVARMRAAGGVLLAKTRPWQDGLEPPVANPHDAERTPGGSSAGEAALIAAGASPIGLASDSGGSLRFPAHCCGIATLKPTAGRVPVTGHFPRVGGMADSRTQIGPMSRSVGDLALALRLIAGPDWRDASVIPMPLGDPAQADVRGLRVAMFDEVDGVRADADTGRVLRDAASTLEAAGAFIEEAKPPRIDESGGITIAYWRRMRSYSWHEWQVDADNDSANPISADEIEQSIFAWDRLNRSMLGFMETRDLLLTPACPYPAPVAGRENVRDFAYTLTWSLTGQPCVVLRAGTSSDGLPIAVQLVARMWRDDVALAAAGVIERGVGPWPVASVGDA